MPAVPRQRRRIPSRIDGEKATALIREVIEARLGRIFERADQVYPDGVIPGTQKLGKREKQARYVVLTAPQDWPLIRDPDYLAKFRAGLLPAPASPFWRNLMALPEMWEEAANEFKALVVDGLLEEEA